MVINRRIRYFLIILIILMLFLICVFADTVAFHGHSCPGLTIGYRMTKAAMAFLADTRAADEELVAIVENNACGVDALQCLSGCTFSKGNLIFKDYGKHVYTLYNRKTRKGVRVEALPLNKGTLTRRQTVSDRGCRPAHSPTHFELRIGERDVRVQAARLAFPLDHISS